MKKIIFILLFGLLTESIFCETLIFSDNNGINIYSEDSGLTLKKENISLSISLEHIIGKRKDIEYKYISSCFKYKKYYYLLSAKDWYYDEPLAHSPYGSGE